MKGRGGEGRGGARSRTYDGLFDVTNALISIAYHSSRNAPSPHLNSQKTSIQHRLLFAPRGPPIKSVQNYSPTNHLIAIRKNQNTETASTANLAITSAITSLRVFIADRTPFVPPRTFPVLPSTPSSPTSTSTHGCARRGHLLVPRWRDEARWERVGTSARIQRVTPNDRTMLQSEVSRARLLALMAKAKAKRTTPISSGGACV